MVACVGAPTAPPIKVPKEGSILATVALLLLQLPGNEVLLKVVVAPAHMVVIPVITDGKGFTTTERVAVQEPIV